MTAIKTSTPASGKAKQCITPDVKHHPYARSSSAETVSSPDPSNAPLNILPHEKKHITISLSDPTLTRYGDAIYDPGFLAIALDPSVSEKEKLKAARGVRNRLSAACSRQKRKELLDGLKDDNERLKGENQVLMDEVKRLRAMATTDGGKDGHAVDVADLEDKPIKAVSAAASQSSVNPANGTIDPTSLCSTSQSAHLVLIGELITTNQSLQQTITSLVTDRDAWKEKYESLMASITRLGAGCEIKQSSFQDDASVPTEDLPESYISSPTKSTTSTLVSEYLLDDLDSHSPADISMDLDSSASSMAPSSSPSTPIATLTMSPSSTTTTLAQNNTCHPAAVQSGKSPAAGVDRANVVGTVVQDPWNHVSQGQFTTPNHEPGLWIPSGLGLDLGLDVIQPTTEDINNYYLPSSGGFDLIDPEQVSEAANDKNGQSSCSGIMQTLFDIGTDNPPLSAISASGFSIPAFDFSTSSTSQESDQSSRGDSSIDESLLTASESRDRYDELAVAALGGEEAAEWDGLGGTMMGSR